MYHTHYSQQENTLDLLNQLLHNSEFQKVVLKIEEIENIRNLTTDEMIIAAKAYKGRFNYSKAAEYLTKAIDKSGYSFSANYMLAMILKELNRSGEAEEHLKEIIKNDPEQYMANIELAGILNSRGRFSEALILLSSVVEKDSINTYLLNRLAYTYLKLGDIECASAVYKRIVRLEPENISAIYHVGKISLQTDSLAAAKLILSKGINIYPDNTSLRKLLAETFFRMEDFEQAIIHYWSVVNSGDSTSSLFQKLGFSYYFIANSHSIQNEDVYSLKIQEALSSFQTAFIMEDKNPVTSYYIGICYKELKIYDEAAIYFNKAVELIFPDYFADLLTNYGSAEEYRGNLGSAISLYNQAYKYDTQKKHLLFYIASAMDRYYADRETPIVYYKKYLQEDKSENQILIKYAKERVESLDTELHFQSRIE